MKRTKEVSGNPARRTRETQLLRATIEVFAARTLAEKVGRGEIDPEPLAQAYEELSAAANRPEREKFNVADVAFHRTFIELADVEGLVESWEVAHSRQAAFQSDTTLSQWPDLNVLVELHRPILDDIVAGDATSARQSVSAHFNPVWYRMAAHGSSIPLERDPLSLARAYLDLHMRQSPQLENVARQICCISASHLARLFRQGLGMSFTAYLRKIRLERAAAMLVESETSIGEIARRVGYRDPSRFAEHFRGSYGVTPHKYRSG